MIAKKGQSRKKREKMREKGRRGSHKKKDRREKELDKLGNRRKRKKGESGRQRRHGKGGRQEIQWERQKEKEQEANRDSYQIPKKKVLWSNSYKVCLKY